MKDKFEVISDDMLHDDRLQKIDMSVYFAILKLLYGRNSSIVVNADTVAYEMGYNVAPTRSRMAKIAESMQRMANCGYINMDLYSGKNYIVSIPEIEHDRFHKLHHSDFVAIMTTGGAKKCDIWYYYCYLRSTMIYGVSNCTLSYLAKLSGIGVKTIINYNEFLEENGIIYVFHSTFYSEGFHPANYYGRYCDKEKVEKKAAMLESNAKANHNRSLGAKYRAMMNGAVYSPEEMAEIRAYCAEWNAKHPDNPKHILA